MSKRRFRMSDENRDGIIFGLALASNPKVTAAREAYYARRREFEAATAHKTKTEMIAELKANYPAYILELLERDSLAGIRDRYVTTFMPRRPA